MFIAGAVATIGIATNAMHTVIGAMLLAPGFMPITRVALGLIARHNTWRYGVSDFIKGYSALLLGAAVATLLLNGLGPEPLPGASSYYAPANKLSQYWSSFSASSILTSVFAGVAGGLLMAAKKSVLASGVMVALALVPSAALIAVGVVEGQFDLAQDAALRFLADVLIVFGCSLLVLGCNRLYSLKRNMQL